MREMEAKGRRDTVKGMMYSEEKSDGDARLFL